MTSTAESLFRALIAGCGLFVTCAASADTLAWYRFGEGADGAQASLSSDAILDSSGHNRHGTVKTVHDKTAVADAALSPTYRTATLPSLVDPLGASDGGHIRALDFVSGRNSSSSGTGAVVQVSSFIGASDRPFGSVTVEAFVCTTGGTYNTLAPIVGFCGSDTSDLSENWSMMMTASGKIAARFCGTLSTGSGSESYSKGTHVINDGRWHHIALVHDAANDVAPGACTARVYVDGGLDATYTYAVTKRTNYSDGPLKIGGYYANICGRLFNGRIAEVRVSDVALGPKDMLQVRYPAIDADTMLYLTFDGVPRTISSTVANLNLVTNGPSMQLAASTKSTADPVPNPAFSDEGSSETLVDGRFGTNRWSNGGSLRLKSNAQGNGWGVYAGSSSYMARSFTSEIFFKADESVGSLTVLDSMPFLFRCGTSTLRVKLGRWLYFQYTGTGTSYLSVGNDKEFVDGKWHHLAVVYDRDAQTIALYVDRRLRYAAEGVNLDSSNYLYFIGGNPASDSSGYFNGWIDEFRHTKRALGPNEFLCRPNDGDEESPDTLLRASFEDGWRVSSGWGKLADAEPSNAVAFVSAERERLAGDLIWETNEVGEAVCRTNLYATKVSRGYVGFPELPYYEGKDITIEMFVKMSEWDATANLFRLAYGDNPGYGGNPICSVYPASATGATLDSLSCRVALTTNSFGGSSVESAGVKWLSLSLPSGTNLADGRWHHLALVAKCTVGEGGVEQTRTRIYVDHKAGGLQNVGGHYVFRSAYSPRPRLSLGCAATDGVRMNACFDEVRVTTRALEPEEFLTATSLPRGMAVIIR